MQSSSPMSISSTGTSAKVLPRFRCASVGARLARARRTDVASLTAYNNVFNPSHGQKTTIKYEVQNSGHVTLRLYTVSGNFIATLFDGDVPAGKGSLDWGGVNVNGRVVASGVYLLYMSGPGINKTQKIVVVK